MNMRIDEATQLAMIELVRGEIEAAVRKERGLTPEELDILKARHRLLGEPAGAFVTIHVDRQLRGCLGEVTPEDELIHVLTRCASRVPLYDYRFSPVRPEELPCLTFDISVLSKPEPLSDIESIVIGRDGLIVRHAGRMGLLLPQVPVEYHWDVPTYLQHLWLKAGIDSDVSVDQVRLWRFFSQVISSERLSHVPPAESDAK